jgi:hypothetical protein
MPEPLPARCRNRVISLLGTKPDYQIARECGCSAAFVYQLRKSLGRPSFRQSPALCVWTSRRIEQLGSCSDAELAGRWQWSTSVVARKRRSLDIPPFQGQEKPLRPIPLAARRRLGKDSDQDIAREFRISSALVAEHRARAGIPSAFGQHRIRWSPAMLRDLKDLGVVAMARRHRLSVATVRLKRAQLHLTPRRSYRPVVRWTTDMLADLGRLNDSAHARRHGLSKSSVLRKRRSLGIAGAVGSGRTAIPRGTTRSQGST